MTMEYERDQDPNQPDQMKAPGEGEITGDLPGSTPPDNNPQDDPTDQEESPDEADESVTGGAGTGGSGPGFVAPPPGTTWPDPMGGQDEERELERRTR